MTTIVVYHSTHMTTIQRVLQWIQLFKGIVVRQIVDEDYARI